MTKYSVYIHSCKFNNKKYVGMTKNVKNRWSGKASRYCCNKQFYQDLITYGWDNFDHEIIKEDLSFQEASELESKLIKFYNTRNPEYGYNIAGGGNAWFGEENPNYGNKKLSEIYQKDKKYAKEKQSRPLGQNGRAIRTMLYTVGDVFIKQFNCQTEAVNYLKEIGVVNPNYLATSVIHYLKRPQGYKGYKLIRP